MKINKLKALITIEKEEVEIDSLGNHRTVYKTFYKCHAYPSTYEKEESGDEVITPGFTVTFLVRYCEKLKALDSVKYRIRYSDDAYNIKAIDFMNYDLKEIKIKCSKEESRDGENKN